MRDVGVSDSFVLGRTRASLQQRIRNLARRTVQKTILTSCSHARDELAILRQSMPSQELAPCP